MGFPATSRPFPDIPFLRATSFLSFSESSRLGSSQPSGDVPQGEAPEPTLESGREPTAEIKLPQEERQIGVYQKGEHIIFRQFQIPHSRDPYPGSLLATLLSGDGGIGIEITDTEEENSDYHDADPTGDTNAFWKTGRAPVWASDWGTDQYGHWVTFTIKKNGKTTIQRLRWMAPGHFSMGSPAQEAERYDDEDPPHEVTVPAGFWLFDTACTQDLWQLVMGNNPSRFKGGNRPVEQVSWNDIQAFLEKINQPIPGLDLVLPSEAEWEYSCRAGTITPFSFGATITPTLANYNGEYPYADGETGVYRKSTVPVASLPPNPWGLYEMHGNVWEWTRDRWREDYRISPDDSPGSGTGVGRAVRGGSWRNVARVVRSAVRDRNRSCDHSSNLGFRCARFGDEPANMELSESANIASEKLPKDLIHVEEQALPSNNGAATFDYLVRLQETSSIGHHPLPAKGFSIRTDREQRVFQYKTKPRWASAIGRDDFGLWAEISLEQAGNSNGQGPVVQRLRWIPPGQFIMGSSKSEWAMFPKYGEKWWNQEGPRHPVILTRGYWLFDTPCTQALWEAVMGNNPSRFQSPRRPVESVSWQEADEFIKKINQRIHGLQLVLPTEAQWEYACRAGTDAATYAGPMEEPGSNNTPVLDAIAWYGGNSGVGFELDNGYDSSIWREKQYDHARAGTHPVAQKRANPWGIYDMLGNVWEWCRDGQREYGKETIIDPVGPTEADVERIVRGGSWYFFARYVRAACRFRYLPIVRQDRLGFRCVHM
uniref:Formylglycine-generating enzyme, required for sulfatase activity, contains SUMF1/FGE domain n=1 Tax=Candidatus Kentrum sp. MB TaxID=2138164 RepID=A0A451BC69_9GAMM|nr:MAG: Formylglycine-generating enzyme, required for sulfatase activity, contains SUMF1/FGE domain [Candidatus Kentron sp. MB]VFK75886.1 MAG: Formylglycine-generating enzyme, required for sulfatase activity, contains SUMF1/FGE domain [Candidatus Kentron sp. MB]